LSPRKTSRNVVVVAVARELAGFLWAEMTADLTHPDLVLPAAAITTPIR
jgi:hypothetical protein